jgi:hypothetical protein
MKKTINTSLYEDNHPETSTKGLGFKDKEKAIEAKSFTINFVNLKIYVFCKKYRI